MKLAKGDCEAVANNSEVAALIKKVRGAVSVANAFDFVQLAKRFVCVNLQCFQIPMLCNVDVFVCLCT